MLQGNALLIQGDEFQQRIHHRASASRIGLATLLAALRRFHSALVEYHCGAIVLAKGEYGYKKRSHCINGCAFTCLNRYRHT